MAVFNVRRTLYVPLVVSLIVSTPLTCAVALAMAAGWLRVLVPGTPRNATAALFFFPHVFVVCVCGCWLVTALLLPRSTRWQAGGEVSQLGTAQPPPTVPAVPPS
jgi:hypothetical protein